MKYLLAFLLITSFSHGQGSIKDEIKEPSLSPIMRELPILRSIPPSDPKPLHNPAPLTLSALEATPLDIFPVDYYT